MEYSANSDKITRDFFNSLLVETRYLDSQLPSTNFSLFGQTFDSPIMTAALSHLNNTTENGMMIYAKAAKKSNIVHWCGMGEDDELEQIVLTGAKTIKIIKPYEDNEVIYQKIKFAQRIGCFAVGIDIDHSFNSKGGYDEVLGLKMKAKTTKELTEFVNSTNLPFVVKGVLSSYDAQKCLEAGCKGIVLSHHHNMQNFSVPPLFMINKIKEIVQNKMTIFADCCFESGIDVYKALALGVNAVSIGRHLMAFLKNGEIAVSNRINEMNDELKSVMARTGIKDLQSMDSSVIYKRTF